MLEGRSEVWRKSKTVTCNPACCQSLRKTCTSWSHAGDAERPFMGNLPEGHICLNCNRRSARPKYLR